MPPPRENPYNLVVCPQKRPNKKLISCLETRTNAANFVEIVQTSRPWGANLWPKFEILTVFGAVFPHFCPYKRKIWHGGADLRCQISRLSGQRVAPAGRKPILDHWVKQYRHGCDTRRPAGNKRTMYNRRTKDNKKWCSNEKWSCFLTHSVCVIPVLFFTYLRTELC